MMVSIKSEQGEKDLTVVVDRLIRSDLGMIMVIHDLSVMSEKTYHYRIALASKDLD
jgi:hypothetical protein